jgi:hypothetical protein
MRRTLFGTVWLLAALTGAAWADNGALPPVQHSGSISYLSGGVGEDEIAAIKAAAPQYALQMTFFSHVPNGRDAYNAPAELTILKDDGSPVLDIKPDGPFVLLDLPPGKYRVTAANTGWSKIVPVDLGHGAHKKLIFQMPEVLQPEQKAGTP